MDVPIPNNKNPSDEIINDVREFMNDLVKICNKHRIFVCLKSVGYLQKDVHDGKLLDVSGFYYDAENKVHLPVLVDIMSGDE